MKSYQVENIKAYMENLLEKEKYDSFYLYETRVKTYLDYYISGKINYDFFEEGAGEEILEEKSQYISWGKIKTRVFEIMKGERPPINFKLVLMFNRDNIQRIIEMNNLALSPEDVGGLFMNILYENQVLTVTTGTTLNVFSLDKDLERLWDKTVEQYYI